MGIRCISLHLVREVGYLYPALAELDCYIVAHSGGGPPRPCVLFLYRLFSFCFCFCFAFALLFLF